MVSVRHWSRESSYYPERYLWVPKEKSLPCSERRWRNWHSLWIGFSPVRHSLKLDARRFQFCESLNHRRGTFANGVAPPRDAVLRCLT